MNQANQFLPINNNDMQARDWHYVDFVCVTGDSYVDHPSFGMAVISRLLESMGFRVGIVAQPKTDEDYLVFGVPRYGFMVSSGNLDSMVNHYTTAKRKRSGDAYTAGGKAGARPDRALTVYCRAIRRLAPESPLVIGGYEASFRRFAHYDYWADEVQPSVLESTGADLLVFGMGERQTREIATRLAAGEPVTQLTDIRGTCYFTSGFFLPEGGVTCASYNRIITDKPAFARAYQIQIEEQDAVYGKPIVQQHDGGRYLIQNPPAVPLSTPELDEVFALPFQRYYHPSYESLGGVAAIEEVEFSIMHNRGCFGGCNFCAITFHQGRAVTSRSKESVVAEGVKITQSPRYKGYIHDVGGPTANFRKRSCSQQLDHGVCKHRKCLAPTPCPSLEVSHKEYLEILRELRQLPGVKKVFVRSGIRYDYLNLDPDKAFLNELVEHHVSGQLKVAPEHCSDPVLGYMGKPNIAAFDRFRKEFYRTTARLGKEQFLVPYLMSSHPGARLRDAVQLAQYLKKNNLRPEQVQDFYPTPGTASTAMFYTGLDPATGKEVYVAKTAKDKAMQRALLQYFDRRGEPLVREALVAAGREDLIGYGGDCLVPPTGGDARRKPPAVRKTTEKSPMPKGKPTGRDQKNKPRSHKGTKGKGKGGKRD